LNAAGRADDLAEEAIRLARPAVMVRDERTGERLAHRRAPQRAAGTGRGEAVDEAALRPARRRLLAAEPCVNCSTF
jgi:hypothetical protein